MTHKELFNKVQTEYIPHGEDMISELRYSFYLISCMYFLGCFLMYLIISGLLSDFTWILHSSFFRWTFTLYIFHLFCLICDALLGWKGVKTCIGILQELNENNAVS